MTNGMQHPISCALCGGKDCALVAEGTAVSRANAQWQGNVVALSSITLFDDAMVNGHGLLRRDRGVSSQSSHSRRLQEEHR